MPSHTNLEDWSINGEPQVSVGSYFLMWVLQLTILLSSSCCHTCRQATVHLAPAICLPHFGQRIISVECPPPTPTVPVYTPGQFKLYLCPVSCVKEQF